MNAEEIVQAYHAASKHHVNRFARSPGYLDWTTQPDPFRRYHGAPLGLLPFPEADATPGYDAIYQPGQVAPCPLSLDLIAEFLECSLALSAWKEFQGSRWALRCNPSSGNLHPTEGYLVVPAIEGLSAQAGVYHYAPREHGLEQRTAFSDELWGALAAEFPCGTFFAGLTSIHWREAWKYGERAYRYCQHDVGHALAAYAVSAAAFGWSVTLLDGLSDADIARWLGVDRDADYDEAEREAPDLVVAVTPGPYPCRVPRVLPCGAIQAIAAGTWTGRANRLSPAQVDWPAIDRVAAACDKPPTIPAATPFPHLGPFPSLPGASCGLSAKQVIQQRRSAVEMDGITAISADVFYRILTRLMPTSASLPWETLGIPIEVDLVLLVHRVQGVVPGMYSLIRNPGHLGLLRAGMKSEFRWAKPVDCPETLPLYQLMPGDCRELSRQVSCGQDIAGDGVFAVSMLARFGGSLQEHGAWFYRRLFWETGMIGQVLYLEAEEAGVRGTGIGCFFDDAVHEVLGIADQQFQALYHFTLGGPIDDPRLTTAPAYTRRRKLEGVLGHG